MPSSDVTLEVIAKLDTVERQLKTLFSRPVKVEVVLDPSSVLRARKQLEVALDSTPIRLSNVSFSSSVTRSIKSSFQKSFDSSPLYVNNIQLGRSAAASLRKSVQAALGGITLPGGGRTTSGGSRGGSSTSLPLGRISGDASEFSKSLDAANARVLAFGASAGAILLVSKALKEVVSSTIEVDKALREINVLLGLTSSDLAQFGSDIFEIAKQTATGFDVAAAAALEFSRQGLSVEETLKRTSAALTLSRISGLDSVKSVDALTTALNSFNKEGLTASQITDKLAAVDAVAATSAGGLAEGVSRVGSAAADAGVSFDELLSLIASAKQITGRSEAVIGNAFKTIFTRLDRSKVRDVVGNLVDINDSDSALQVLQKLATNYDKLSKSQQAYVSEIVAGVFQINQFKAVISDLGSEQSVFKTSLDAAQNSLGVSDKRVKELTQSLSDLAQIAGTNLKEGFAAIGSITFAGPSSNALKGFNSISDTIKKSIQDVSSGNGSDLENAGVNIGKGILKGISDFLGGPGLAIVAAIGVKLFSELAKFSKSNLQGLLGVNNALKIQLELEAQIGAKIQQKANLNKRLLAGVYDYADAVNAVISKINKENTLIEKQIALNKELAAIAAKRGVGFDATTGRLTTDRDKELTNKPNLLSRAGTALKDPFNFAILASIIGESVSESISKDTKGGRGAAASASAIGNIGSAAAIGSIFGPEGTVIGGALAALLQFSKVTDAFTSDIPEFQKRLDSATKQFNDFSTLSQSILSLQSQYDDLKSTVNLSATAQKQLTRIQQNLASELSKLPKDLRDKFLGANTFEKRSSILNEAGQKDSREVLNSSIAKQLQEIIQGAENSSLRIAQKGITFATSGAVATPNRDDDSVLKSIREQGSRALGDNLTEKQLKDVANNAKDAANVFRILGQDVSNLNDQELNAFTKALRSAANAALQTGEVIKKARFVNPKINQTDNSAFFRDKSAPQAITSLTQLKDSTTANRSILNQDPLKITSLGVVNKLGEGVTDAFTKALQRNDAIKGDVNNFKDQAKLSGLEPDQIKTLLETFINKQGLASEFNTNNRIALGEVTKQRSGAILDQSRITGLDNGEQKGLINQAIGRDISTGSPTNVDSIIARLTDQSKRSNPQEQKNLSALIGSLQIFSNSLKNNQGQKSALFDTNNAVEQKIDTATIDIQKATISIDGASLPAFINQPSKQPFNGGNRNDFNQFQDTINRFDSKNGSAFNPSNLDFKGANLGLGDESESTKKITELQSSLDELTKTLNGTINIQQNGLDPVSINGQSRGGDVNLNASVNLTAGATLEQINDAMNKLYQLILSKANIKTPPQSPTQFFDGGKFPTD